MKKLFHLLGPGLLWAGAAIGVSHLVQSTRAGAEYGFALIGIIIFANIIKYPFFEFAPRFVAGTGKHLIFGYSQIGKWAVILFGIMTILTMIIIQSAVTIVTASLVANIFHLHLTLFEISIILLLITMVIVSVGRYTVIDNLMKIVIISLAISTILAIIIVFSKDLNPKLIDSFSFDFTNPINLAFVIALVGWMPAPIDIAVWHSFWSYTKEQETKQKITLKNALIDFNVGYIGTTILAIGFLLLGATVMYGTNETLSPKGTVFAGQLIKLYTDSIGDWSYPIIAIASITTMFSTTLMCLDAYSKVLQPVTNILIPKISKNNNLKWFWLIMVVGGSLILIGYFTKNMRFMVDLATTISFVTAPILAYLNYRVTTDKLINKNALPPLWLKVFAIIGLVFLTLFSLSFLYWRYFI